MYQSLLFEDTQHDKVKPLKTQLLKWIGNKQRFAHEIASLFPINYNSYFEPFLGSGAVLATHAPKSGLGSDVLMPLMEIWKALKSDPDLIKNWYRSRWELARSYSNNDGYEIIKSNYNNNPNGPDLLFLCRACYGGVVRFRKSDGYMSTPCGIHAPISPESFNKRVNIWHDRIKHIDFEVLDYKEAFSYAKKGDLIYCDPPYLHSQPILYRGQLFRLEELIDEIQKAKDRGVYIALSIDGTKKSGDINCTLPIPENLFEREIFVNLGRSMLKRFQMKGESLEDYVVSDRLLLTY